MDKKSIMPKLSIGLDPHDCCRGQIGLSIGLNVVEHVDTFVF